MPIAAAAPEVESMGGVHIPPLQTPTSTADQWLADAFTAAYYDIRGRYGPMACRSPIARGSEFCSEALEVEPRA